jgi:hypothetical protein
VTHGVHIDTSRAAMWSHRSSYYSQHILTQQTCKRDASIPRYQLRTWLEEENHEHFVKYSLPTFNARRSHPVLYRQYYRGTDIGATWVGRATSIGTPPAHGFALGEPRSRPGAAPLQKERLLLLLPPFPRSDHCGSAKICVQNLRASARNLNEQFIADAWRPEALLAGGALMADLRPIVHSELSGPR